MTLHVINADDQIETGFVRLFREPKPSIALKPKSKRGNLKGLIFNNKEELKKAADFLQSAYKELYGDEHHGGSVETGKDCNPGASGESGVRKEEGSSTQGSEGIVSGDRVP